MILRGIAKNLLKKLPPQFGEKLEEIPNVLAVQEKSIKIVMEKINFLYTYLYYKGKNLSCGDSVRTSTPLFVTATVCSN
jgi:hypothetical protein